MVDAMWASHTCTTGRPAKASCHRIAYVALAMLSLSAASWPAQAQQLQIPRIPPKPDPAAPRVAPISWCQYPHHNRQRAAAPRGGARLSAIIEAEPNNTIADAQPIPIGLAPVLDPDFDISGAISDAADVDVFRVTLGAGDILGVAVVASGSLDPVVGVFESDGTLVFLNDDGFGLESLYPLNAPWPLAENFLDSALTYTVPVSGDYHIAVFPYQPDDIGGYSLQMRLRRPFIQENFLSPTRQKIFLDFDGATIDSSALFGSPAGLTFLSPLSDFLAGWGLTPADEGAVIDAIVGVVNSDFDALRQFGALNGDFPTDQILGHYNFEILNSRDHPDPFGQPNVSRVVIGGTADQLGFLTLGIAEHIDPGNYNPENTAVVLLDLLSTLPGDPFFSNSVNSIPRAPNTTIFEAIGLAVGHITSHEIGHYVGVWHTNNFNAVDNIMDAGGVPLTTLVGAGIDGILGTNDDITRTFITDDFEPFEYVGIGKESADVICAFSLSTGGLPPDLTAPQVITEVPARDSGLGSLDSIEITFDEPVTTIVPEALQVNGSPATTVFGSGAGPYIFVGFDFPTDGTATVALGTAQISDVWDNNVPLQNWTYDIRDCNANLLIDEEDIAQGVSEDCNANAIPDECDPMIVRAELGPDKKIRFGDVILLGPEVNIIGGIPPFTFEWTLRGSDTEQSSNSQTPGFTPVGPGTYVVRLIIGDSQGCKSLSYLTITVDGSAAAGLPLEALCGNTCGATGAPVLAAMIAGWMSLGWQINRRRSRR
jgi:hypothetical protein